MPNEKDPVRKNIEDILDIRDAATHLIIKELEAVYSGLFQSGVLNYVNKLEEWFVLSITDRISPAMLTLVTDIKRIDPVRIRKRYGPETLRFVESEMERLEKNEKEMSNLTYRIPIEYRLVLTKSSKDADVRLSSGVDGKPVVVMEVPRDIERTHPHLQKDIIPRIKAKIGEDVIFNKHDFQAILHKENIKGNHRYHYMTKKPPAHLYSDALITRIVSKIQKDPQYLQNARAWYRRHREDKRKRQTDRRK